MAFIKELTSLICKGPIMSISSKITPNQDHPNNEAADLKAENLDATIAQALGSPSGTKKPLKRNSKSQNQARSHGSVTTEEQEKEDLEVDEDLEDGVPEQPGNVPRF
jgi:hypothetical protein